VRLAAERRAQQGVDLVPRLLVWQAAAELKIDETDEERIERTPGGQELLRDLGEAVGARDHAGKGADLAAGALGVADGSGSLIDGVERTHGRTMTAPVMPAAA